MLFKRTAYALVAQLDRVFGYEPNTLSGLPDTTI